MGDDPIVTSEAETTLVGKSVKYVLEGGNHPGEIREAVLLTDPDGPFYRANLMVSVNPDDFDKEYPQGILRLEAPRSEINKIHGTWHVT